MQLIDSSFLTSCHSFGNGILANMAHPDTHKTALEAEKKTLEKELQELGYQDKTAPADWVATPEEPSDTEPDENLVADRSEEWIERRGEMAALETRYNNVKQALEKIASGSYGTCEVCEKEIEADRLTANPAARTCMAHLEEENKLQ